MSEERKTGALVALVLGHASRVQRAELEAIQGLEAFLHQHVEAARAAWPTLQLTSESFVRHLPAGKAAVIRNSHGQATAVLWLQGAFEPPATTPPSVLLMGRQQQGPARQMLGQFHLPPLVGGRVVRWLVPLELPPEVDEVHFQVESELHPKAGRVRPAWKLFDTLEVPKESDMKALSSEVSMGIDLGESLVDSVLSGGLSVSFSMEMGTRVSPGLDRSLAVKRHAAATLPTAYIAAVVDGPLEPLSEPRCELVWEPGMPLPTASAAPGWGTPSADARVAPPQNPQRTCYACGFEGPRVAYERATICPRCEAAGCRHGLPERRSTHSRVKHSPSLGMPMTLPARLHTSRR